MFQPSTFTAKGPLGFASHIWSEYRVGLAIMGILGLTFALEPPQAIESMWFTIDALLSTAPFLILSILMAAYASATGADGLIAKAFTGAPVVMIVAAAALGGLSPFCSCGVIPLIAALLAMGVPLAPVMAFWLASPVIDPSMFILTTGLLGFEFAVAKTLTAVGLGLFGGGVTHALTASGHFRDVLKPQARGGCCGAASLTAPKPVAWKFWTDPARRSTFGREAWGTTVFLVKWLALAFLLESLMLAYVPAAWISGALGGSGLAPIVTATFVGVPAYLNGYAALPLVSGLMEQGMVPGAGLTFLVAGGVTSLPAAIAVYALVRPRVFALYIALALSGSLASGLLYQLWLGSAG